MLPPARALACAVDRYSLTAASWQAAQLAGLSFGSCGSFSAETSLWQSVHLKFIWPCTEPAKAFASTAIDLPAAFLAPASPWHIRQASFGAGAASAAVAGARHRKQGSRQGDQPANDRGSPAGGLHGGAPRAESAPLGKRGQCCTRGLRRPLTGVKLRPRISRFHSRNLERINPKPDCTSNGHAPMVCAIRSIARVNRGASAPSLV